MQQQKCIQGIDEDNPLKPVHFKKNISIFSLTMTGVTTVIGSGWLLSTQKICAIAGPAGLLSWVLGACVALLVSLFFLEVGSSCSSAGGIGFYSHLTHGRFCGFLTSWINWLSIVAIPPVEAQGVVQYLSQLTPTLQHWYIPASHQLSTAGIIASVVLMFFFMLANYWSVRLFLRFNNVFATIKIIVPILTIIVLCVVGLHSGNFGLQHLHAFAPDGWSSVFVGVITCGVVMSFNGFQSPLTFSEEIADPKRMLPIAVISTIIIAFIIYFLLQVVFIGSVSPGQVAAGWSNINFRSPYVDLLLIANLHLMVVTVYAASVISPGAAGMAYIASSSRILYSLSHEKHFPAFLSKLHPHYHSPRYSIIASTLVGCLFLLMFTGWYQLVAVISILHIFSYIPAPIVTLAHRLQHPEKFDDHRQFKLPLAGLLAPCLLFVLSILLFYAAWPLTGQMVMLILPGLAFYFYYENKYFPTRNVWSNFRGASWLIFYFIGINLIAFFGNHPGSEYQVLSLPLSFGFLALLAVAIQRYGIYVANSAVTLRQSNQVAEENPAL